MTHTIVANHSGYTYAERPRAFEWQGLPQKIKTIIAEWQTPQGKYFRVQTHANQTFELVYKFARDEWEVFQQENIK